METQVQPPHDDASFAASPLLENDGVVTAEKIHKAVATIVQLANPVKVIAFGSRARGTHRHDSDLDLAVIVDHYNSKSDPRPVWRADIDVWMDMDLVVYDLAREQILVESPISLQSLVRKEGVVLHDRKTGFIDRSAAARLVGRSGVADVPLAG